MGVTVEKMDDGTASTMMPSIENGPSFVLESFLSNPKGVIGRLVAAGHLGDDQKLRLE